MSLIACAQREQLLLGQWRYADAIQSCEYRFAADRTFSGTVVYRGRKLSEFTGRWKVEGDKLLYDYSTDVLGNIPPGSKDSDRLLAVAQDHFEIEAGDGSRRRYERVR